jgi:hypothetical protein
MAWYLAMSIAHSPSPITYLPSKLRRSRSSQYYELSSMSSENRQATDPDQQASQAFKHAEKMWKEWMGIPIPQPVQTQGSGYNGGTGSSVQRNRDLAETAHQPITPIDTAKTTYSQYNQSPKTADSNQLLSINTARCTKDLSNIDPETVPRARRPAGIPKIVVSPGAPPGPWASCHSSNTQPSPNSQDSMTDSPGLPALSRNAQSSSVEHKWTGIGQHTLTLKYNPAASAATSPVIRDNPGYDGMSDASDSEGTQSPHCLHTAKPAGGWGHYQESGSRFHGESLGVRQADQQGPTNQSASQVL